MLGTNIVEFDREAIRGRFEFTTREQKRSGISLLAPPSEHGSGASEFARSNFTEDAKNIEVGIALLVMAGGSGSVQDHGDKPAIERLPQAIHDLVERRLHGESNTKFTRELRGAGNRACSRL